MQRYVCRLLVALGIAVLWPSGAEAQGVTEVTGQVTAAATGQPMVGVQVVVKGTTLGTVTGANGNYTIRVPAGSTTLVFSYMGYATTEAAITGPVLNVRLATEVMQLDELVVTALGITQRERAISTAVQSVRGEELTQAREANIVNALSGKVAGVSITNTSTQGGSSRIVIRGASSLTGSNQPLFIVDGVPVDNSAPRLTGGSGGSTGRGAGAVDYGNAAADINPNDIESVTVLKGANAAALYGSRAANGAIIITTKSGRNAAAGLGISASSNVTFETPLRLPEYQNQYGQGYGGQFSYVDGRGGGTRDGVDESWGPRTATGRTAASRSPTRARMGCTPA